MIYAIVILAWLGTVAGGSAYAFYTGYSWANSANASRMQRAEMRRLQTAIVYYKSAEEYAKEQTAIAQATEETNSKLIKELQDALKYERENPKKVTAISKLDTECVDDNFLRKLERIK